MKSTITLYDESIPKNKLITVSVSDEGIGFKKYALELDFPGFERKVSMDLAESDLEKIIRVFQSVMRGVRW